MVEQSVFRGVLEFFDKIGIYDVILPFLLVFTIVFAILEKTAVFGREKPSRGENREETTRKNLNAMAAFVISFFVVASSRLVEIITEVSANAVVLLMASVLFLILVGSFHQETKEGFFLKDWTKTAFVIVMFAGIAAIFLNAIKMEDGRTWLKVLMDYIGDFWSNEVVASLILLAVVIGMLFWLTRGSSSSGSSSAQAENKK